MRKFFGFGSSTPPPSANEPPLVGRWKEPRGTDITEFHGDGAVTEKPARGGKIRGRYSVEGTKVIIHLEGVAEALSFSAVVNGNSLEMTGPDGETTRYERIS